MAGRRASGTHFHGHIDPAWSSNPDTGKETLHIVLDSPDETANWLCEQLREATGNPDLDLTDERALWVKLARNKETVSTGLQTGPTITAVPLSDENCWCRRPELQPVGKGNKK